METPSSLRMLTTSQKSKQEGSRTNANERSALLDITNDSPIVGLATTTGDLSENTPSSAVKNRVPGAKNTPGSGEALLRWQVRTLLQKVEEEGEGEFLNKLSSTVVDRPSIRVLLDIPAGPSPTLILAPTPANTPEIFNLSAVGPVLMDECLVNRALLFESPGKSESSNADSSSLTYQGGITTTDEDDNSSAWSLQVNNGQEADDYDDDVEEGIEEFGNDEEDEEEGDDDDDDDGCYDELCAGISKMSLVKGGGLPEFMGKHSRFVYNSDDEEIEREEVIKEKISPDVLLLKGLPVPEGKHLRFHQEEDEEEQ